MTEPIEAILFGRVGLCKCAYWIDVWYIMSFASHTVIAT